MTQERIMQGDIDLNLIKKTNAVFCHDLSNPLSIIRMTVQELLKSSVDGKTQNMESMRPLLQMAFDATQRITTLIQSMQVFSGQPVESLMFSEVPIQKILEDSFTSSQSTLKKYGSQILPLKESPSIPISCEPAYLKVAIHQLLKNSAEAGATQIEVHIEKKEEPKRVEITVTDNGQGISKEMISDIFTPFATSQTDKKGMGIGLYVAKTIIEKHQGTLLLKESKRGHTAFMISLPF